MPKREEEIKPRKKKNWNSQGGCLAEKNNHQMGYRKVHGVSASLLVCMLLCCGRESRSPIREVKTESFFMYFLLTTADQASVKPACVCVDISKKKKR